MAQNAQEADFAFRPTLDPALATTTFQPGTTASNVELNISAAIKKQQQESATSYVKTLHILVATRTIRGVVSAWRKQVSVGEEVEPGYLVDKFDYGYDAMHSIRPKNNEPDSLEYQLVGCMTGEFKRHQELSVELLQDIVKGASKAYLKLTHLIDTAGEEGKQVVAGFDLEKSPETATYTAILREPPQTQRASKRKYQSPPLEDVEAAGAVAKRQKLSLKPQSQRRFEPGLTSSRALTPTSETLKKRGIGMGNYRHGSAIPWQLDEDYFAQQQIRADPSMTWRTLVSKVNDRFEGTYYTHPRTGLMRRGPRTVHAVRQRLVKFKQEMQERDEKSLPRRGTETDIEPEENYKGSQCDEASLQGTEGGTEVDAGELL